VITIRPENLQLGKEGENAIQARIRSHVYVGTHTRFKVETGELRFEVVAEASSVDRFRDGDVLSLKLPREKIWLVS
jgi:ABC-type Fe3+/spermidine/putrescine transport system ATPase subunit